MQDKILENINQIGKFIELKSKAPSTSAPTPTAPHVTSPVTSSPPETVSTNTETHTHGAIPTIDVTSTHPTITTTIHSAHGTAPITSLQPPNTSRLPNLLCQLSQETPSLGRHFGTHLMLQLTPTPH